MAPSMISPPTTSFLTHRGYARLWSIVLTATAAIALALGWYACEWDLALSCYGVASVFSVYAMVFRFALWFQRPPTQHMYLRALKELRTPMSIVRCGRTIVQRSGTYFAANAFVWKRGPDRWLAHWPIMIGCVMAANIAFPLVFGWVWFRTPVDNLQVYECMCFGMPLFQFPVDSFFAFLIFHGLVWASFPVLFGVTVAFIRRLRHRGDQACQSFAYDFLPLLALAIIALSGLLLSVSYTWWAGYGHESIAIFHAIVVILCIVALPCSKLFHVPQRTLKLAHIINASSSQERAVCSRCDKEFAALWQIEDLKSLQAQLGFRYELQDGGHYQDICPQCRRANFVLAQGQRWQNTSVSALRKEPAKEIL